MAEGYSRIKPLSVNEAWQGKRFKTEKYKRYETALLVMLPSLNLPSGKLKIDLIIGFSNKASDIDNPIKPFLDILQKKYKFDDKDIYQLNITKNIVPKGEEHIKYKISKHED